MPAILISADIFHMGVFSGPAAPAYPKSFDAEGDRDGLFLVLQPLVLLGSGPLGPLPEAIWRYPHLVDYFAAPPPSIGDANHPAVLANQLIVGAGWPSAEQWRDAGVPVPFPPLTRFDIELKITYDGDANPTTWRYRDAIPDYATDVRPLIGDAGLVAPAADWPQIAVQSFIRPQILDYLQLNADQQAEVRDWLIGAIAQLRSPPDAMSPTTAQTAIRTQYIINDPVFGPSVVSQNDDARVLQWRRRLQSQPSLSRSLYAAFLAPDPEAPPGTSTRQHFDPPAYKYGPNQLPPADVLFPNDGANPIRQGSYHHLLWTGIRGQLQNADAETEQQIAKSLARLYGLGERLRWPDASRAHSPDRFMVLDTQSDRLANAIGTNAQSLAGQVFRVGDLRKRITNVEIVQFQINGFELVWGSTQQAVPNGPQDPFKARMAQSIVDFSTAVKAHSGQKFSVTLKQDPANPKGLVQFQPRLGSLLDEPLGQGLEVPRSLLDYAQRSGRMEMPWGGDQLVVQNPQRTGLTKDEVLGGEQFVTGTQTLKCAFRLRVRVVRRPRLGAGQASTGGSPATYVYDIAIAEPLAPAENILVTTAFTSPGARALELWIAQAGTATVVLPLIGPLVHLSSGGPHPLPLIRIVDGKTIDLLDAALEKLPQALKSDRGFALNLAIRNLDKGDTFNVVPSTALPDKRSLLGLTTRFDTTAGQSADLLASRFEANFDPPPTDPLDPVFGHYRNFSKLRLATQFGPKWTLLTYPDALAPLKTPSDGPERTGDPAPDPVNDPLGAGRPTRAGSPLWSYAIVHRFDRELDDGADGQGATARAKEEARYRFVVTPGDMGQFGGYVEHQYSTRLALAGAPAASFPIEHPVNNAAELTSELHKPASRASGPERRETIALLGFTCDLAAQTITLSFDSGYLKQAFTDAWANGGPRTTLDAYRTIYEAFADLRTALSAGRLELRLEGWTFDNRRGGMVGAEAPDFLRTFRPVGRGAVKASAITNLDADLNMTIGAFLGTTFAQFSAKIDALVAGTSALQPLRPVSLADPAWIWTSASGGIYSPADLADQAIVSRASIRIVRPSSAVIPPSTEDGRFLPLALSDELRNIAIWSPTPGTTGYESLAPAAKAELAVRLKEGSDLFERATWMVCRNRLDPRSPPSFEATFQVHFGETANLLSVPAVRARNVPLVTDLYYATYGFLPIAKHPDLPDALVTLEFASWLVNLVQAILDGTPFAALEFDHTVSAQDAEIQRQAIEDLVGVAGGIAEQICALVKRVDDPTLIDKAHVDTLYQKVNGLLSKIDGNMQSALRSALCSRFAYHPKEFADLRGLGVIVFDPDRESPALYSLRINKRIREDLTEPMTRGAPRNDADEFHHTSIAEGAGVRFLLDGLDDVTYDAEFTIEQNRYMQGGAVVHDHSDLGRLGEARTLDGSTHLVLRGDAQARTGEDVIEADLDPANLLRRYQPDQGIDSWDQDPQPNAAAQRQLEVNVVHFNPSWRVRKAGYVKAWQYLLPSRIPPSKPAVLSPRQAIGGTDAPDPRVSTVRIGANEDPMQKGLFGPRLAAALNARNIVFVDLEGGKPGSASLTLTNVPDYTVIQADPNLTRGWQRYDTVLAHHYFLVDADPDATPADIIQDDAILIDTSADDDAPLQVPTAPATDGLQTGSLYQWFWYDRMRRTPGAQANKPGVKPTLATAVDEIYRAFDVNRTTHIAGGHSILKAAIPGTAFGNAAAYLPALGGGFLKPAPLPATDDVIGSVLAAEIFTVSGDAQNTVTRYAVRVTTLETPLRRTRVRLRVLRNYRDVDADLHNDIAQAFEMTSPFSEWSERSDRAIRLGPADFIGMGATRGWILETGVTLADWLSIDIGKPAGDPALRRDFGPVLQSVIRATTAANAHCRLWGIEAEDKRWTLFGIAHDAGRDAHVIIGNRGPDRAERVHRQNLVAASGQGLVSWSQVNELTAALDRKQIVSARFEMTFVWSNQKGQNVMELTFPVSFAR